MKENKGVTLVALVVTIIILIILAGVSINMLVGDNGIITLTQKAKENTELAKLEEEQNLNSIYDELINYNSISFPSGDGNELQNKFDALKKEYDSLQADYGTFKATIAQAITEKGIQTDETATAETMAQNIKSLSGATIQYLGSSTSINVKNTLPDKYASLTKDNFLVEFASLSANGGAGNTSGAQYPLFGQIDASSRMTKSYDASTGVLTISGLSCGDNYQADTWRRWVNASVGINVYVVY